MAERVAGVVGARVGRRAIGVVRVLRLVVVGVRVRVRVRVVKGLGALGVCVLVRVERVVRGAAVAQLAHELAGRLPVVGGGDGAPLLLVVVIVDRVLRLLVLVVRAGGGTGGQQLVGAGGVLLGLGVLVGRELRLRLRLQLVLHVAQVLLVV